MSPSCYQLTFSNFGVFGGTSMMAAYSVPSVGGDPDVDPNEDTNPGYGFQGMGAGYEELSKQMSFSFPPVISEDTNQRISPPQFDDRIYDVIRGDGKIAPMRISTGMMRSTELLSSIAALYDQGRTCEIRSSYWKPDEISAILNTIIERNEDKLKPSFAGTLYFIVSPNPKGDAKPEDHLRLEFQVHEENGKSSWDALTPDWQSKL